MPTTPALTDPLAGLPVPPLRVGAGVGLAGVAFAAVCALIGVSTSSAGVAAGEAVGFSILVLLAAGTVGCALACLQRGRLEIFGILGVAAAVGVTDMVAYSLWRGFGGESYAKALFLLVAWSLVFLLVLSLVLAAPLAGPLTRLLRHASYAGSLLAGLVITWVVLFDLGSKQSSSSSSMPTDGSAESQIFGIAADASSQAPGATQLRILAIALVVGIVAWLGTVAASKLEGAGAAERR